MLKQGTGLPAASREEYFAGADSIEPDPAGFREQVACLLFVKTIKFS